MTLTALGGGPFEAEDAIQREHAENPPPLVSRLFGHRPPARISLTGAEEFFPRPKTHKNEQVPPQDFRVSSSN